MASTFHARSISLPSGCHPLAASVDEQLNRLRISQETSTSSVSDLCQKLDGLNMLYDCVDDLLQLPLIQQNLSISNEELLNGSIKILDMCDISRDVLSQFKECLRDLESSFRRRTVGDEAVLAYMIARKKISKLVCKSLKSLKRTIETKRECSDPVFKMLSEAEEISFAMFESLLSLIFLPKANGWSSVSKLFQPKRVSSCETMSELERLDATLVLLTNKKSTKDISLQSILRQSGDLNSSIEELEQNLECLYRLLLKTRVTLLNI